MATSAAKRRTIRETTEVLEDEDDEETGGAEDSAADLHPEAPIFSPLLRQAKRIEAVGLRRLDPDSGYLCAMTPDVTESMIKSRWGGGTYRLEGKNAGGQIVKNGVLHCKIAGDPVFSSEVEENEWRHAHRLKGKADGGDGQTSVRDLIAMLEDRDEKRRAEQLGREEKARAESAAREEQQRKDIEAKLTAEREARAEERRQQQKDSDARDERRRAQAIEDDERRSRQHKEDMERLAVLNQQTLQQSQTFYQQLAATLKKEGPSEDPIKTLLAGVQLAATIRGDGAGGGGGGGGEEGGTLASIAKRLPEILSEARQTGAAILGEIKSSAQRGGGVARNAAAAPKGDELVIRGALAVKARAVLAALEKAGKNPEQEVDQLLNFAAASVGVQVAAPAPAPASRLRAAPTKPAAASSRPRPAASRPRQPAASSRPRPAASRPRQPPPRLVPKRRA